MLASIWNGVQIDNYPVVAGYISPPAPNTDNVRESQYCLQCAMMSIAAHHGEVRCDLRHLLPGRFLLNPVPVKHSGQAIVTSNADVPIFLPLFVNVQLNNVIEQEKIGNFVVPPYDLHCPSVEPHLSKRCCSVCGLYYASVKSALSHSRDCHRSVYCDCSPTGEEATCKNSCQTSTGDDGRPSRPLEWRNSRMG